MFNCLKCNYAPSLPDADPAGCPCVVETPSGPVRISRDVRIQAERLFRKAQNDQFDDVITELKTYDSVLFKIVLFLNNTEDECLLKFFWKSLIHLEKLIILRPELMPNVLPRLICEKQTSLMSQLVQKGLITKELILAGLRSIDEPQDPAGMLGSLRDIGLFDEAGFLYNLILKEDWENIILLKNKGLFKEEVCQSVLPTLFPAGLVVEDKKRALFEKLEKIGVIKAERLFSEASGGLQNLQYEILTPENQAIYLVEKIKQHDYIFLKSLLEAHKTQKEGATLNSDLISERIADGTTILFWLTRNKQFHLVKELINRELITSAMLLQRYELIGTHFRYSLLAHFIIEMPELVSVLLKKKIIKPSHLSEPPVEIISALLVCIFIRSWDLIDVFLENDLIEPAALNKEIKQSDLNVPGEIGKFGMTPLFLLALYKQDALVLKCHQKKLITRESLDAYWGKPIEIDSAVYYCSLRHLLFCNAKTKNIMLSFVLPEEAEKLQRWSQDQTPLFELIADFQNLILDPLTKKIKLKPGEPPADPRDPGESLLEAIAIRKKKQEERLRFENAKKEAEAKAKELEAELEQEEAASTVAKKKGYSKPAKLNKAALAAAKRQESELVRKKLEEASLEKKRLADLVEQEKQKRRLESDQKEQARLAAEWKKAEAEAEQIVADRLKLAKAKAFSAQIVTERASAAQSKALAERVVAEQASAAEAKARAERVAAERARAVVEKAELERLAAEQVRAVADKAELDYLIKLNINLIVGIQAFTKKIYLLQPNLPSLSQLQNPQLAIFAQANLPDKVQKILPLLVKLAEHNLRVILYGSSIFEYLLHSITAFKVPCNIAAMVVKDVDLMISYREDIALILKDAGFEFLERDSNQNYHRYKNRPIENGVDVDITVILHEQASCNPMKSTGLMLELKKIDKALLFNLTLKSKYGHQASPKDLALFVEQVAKGVFSIEPPATEEELLAEIGGFSCIRDYVCRLHLPTKFFWRLVKQLEKHIGVFPYFLNFAFDPNLAMVLNPSWQRLYFTCLLYLSTDRYKPAHYEIVELILNNRETIFLILGEPIELVFKAKIMKDILCSFFSVLTPYGWQAGILQNFRMLLEKYQSLGTFTKEAILKSIDLIAGHIIFYHSPPPAYEAAVFVPILRSPLDEFLNREPPAYSLLAPPRFF